MSATFPWHMVIPLAALGWSAKTRSYASSERMIRPIPRSGERGGSSGMQCEPDPGLLGDGNGTFEEPGQALPELLLRDRRRRRVWRVRPHRQVEARR